MRHHRLKANQGIAIGMILFVISIIAVIAIAITAGGPSMNTTIVPDRVMADMKSQGNLIRNKLLECYTYGYERGDLADKYPSSSGTGTLVSAVTCPSYVSGNDNLWTGQSPAQLPPPTSGFDQWYYVNAGAAGGRCIRIQPLPGTVGDVGLKNGLSGLSSYFNASEYVYDSASSSQRFILWITRPAGTPSANCSS